MVVSDTMMVGGDPPALSQSQHTAVANLQRHWRGLAQRLHVLRKWSWVVSNGLENREEQRMVALGVFVESIAEELAPGPSLERRASTMPRSSGATEAPEPK